MRDRYLTYMWNKYTGEYSTRVCETEQEMDDWINGQDDLTHADRYQLTAENTMFFTRVIYLGTVVMRDFPHDWEVNDGSF